MHLLIAMLLDVGICNPLNTPIISISIAPPTTLATESVNASTDCNATLPKGNAVAQTALSKYYHNNPLQFQEDPSQYIEYFPFIDISFHYLKIIQKLVLSNIHIPIKQVKYYTFNIFT